MKFTLKEYQAEAVDDVLNRLGRAREAYRGQYRSTSSFSLTATTGAGKTVMAAAVLEALFEGNDEVGEQGFEADPTAVVLWFTDDPSLNEQTRSRLLEASDLDRNRLRVIEPTYAEDRLLAGSVYFLNAQKLSRNSLLVRGAPTGDDRPADESLALDPPPPDLRARTFWEILRNTIQDPDLTLYLILDEAHRGMGGRRGASERKTIVRRLIDGDRDQPPVPIVWGISATVQRFEDAMSELGNERVKLPAVRVSSARVQESGLLKDDIRLDFPAEKGQFDTALLMRAVRRTREITELWRQYAAGQDPPPQPVVPLLVVQMPNTPSDELLAEAFRTVREGWPELSEDAMAHVFGEHRTIELGGFTIEHIAPEKVQESTWVRVLFAKDAVSTGWDCPRAEVLMSFRPASDRTHITQLLGRMVRNPLARRVPGDDRLNSVECVLPSFNRATATQVGELLLGLVDDDDGDDPGSGPQPLIDPVELRPDSTVGDPVWAAFDAMPSQTLPKRAARPTRQLLALAQALSRDGLRAGARGEALEEMCLALDAFAARHPKEVEHAFEDVRTLSGTTVVARGDDAAGFGEEVFAEVADERAVGADFARAGRVLTRDLARVYADRYVNPDDPDDDDLIEAEVQVAALAKVEGVADALDTDAERIARRWWDDQRVAIRELSDERQAAYGEIKAMTREPIRTDVQRPRVRLESSRDLDGERVPTVTGHLMTTPDGSCPVGSLNDWERAVLSTEMHRRDFRAWYRNPSRASADALAVAYRAARGEWRRMCPDFVFFHGVDAAVRTSIVDPHGHHLGDALLKLRGLAAFAENFAGAFHRIEAISRIGETLRVLDLTRSDVRSAVEDGTSVERLYAGRLAQDYR